MLNDQFLADTTALFSEDLGNEERLRAVRDAAAEGVVQYLGRLADDAVTQRQSVERRWLANMCQYWGVRSVSELTSKAEPLGASTNGPKDQRSTVFVNITRSKTNRMIGRLFDILFPADDRNWGLKPTPSPDLIMVAKRAMEEAEGAVEEANRLRSQEGAESPTGMSEGELVDKAKDLAPASAAAQRELDEAKQRAERMGVEIDDQLVEAYYAQKCRDALEWAGKIGVGIIKGPIVMDGGRKAWQQSDEGGFALQASGEKARPTFEVVSPWGFFPDPSAASMQEAEYVFERHLLSRSQLRKMGRKLGFDKRAMQELMTNGPGQATGDDFSMLRNLRTLSGEDTNISNRYVIWEYHGVLETEQVSALLRSYADPAMDERAVKFEEGTDPFDEFRVIAYFCDGKLLKITEYYPLDSCDFIYSVYSIEKGAASILGAIGIPEMMRDSQGVLNAAWRMMMDNAKLAVGPQVLIDKTKVDPADGEWGMYPLKEWLWKSTGGQPGIPPFQTFNIPMNQSDIAGIIGLAKSFIDDETAMPSFIEGGNSEERAPGAASTLGGMAMLMNSAGVNVRRMVKNWDDDVTSGVIRRLYDWNMQHSDKDEIKGDMQVEARGVSALLVREMQQQMLLSMANTWTVHPVLGPMLKNYEMARLSLQSAGISPADVLIEREEYDKRIANMAKEPEAVDPQWENRLQIAQIDAQSRQYQADAQRDVAVLRVSEEGKLTIAEIEAQLQKSRDANRSKERLAAVEIAVEQRNADAARAEGLEPTGSGGNISMGREKPA